MEEECPQHVRLVHDRETGDIIGWDDGLPTRRTRERAAGRVSS